jgi:hypothetical protein
VAPSTALIVALAAAAGATGCGDIFGVDAADPQDKIPAEETFTLEQTLVGARAKLTQAFDLKIVWAGLLGDEFVSSGTAPGIQEWDRRAVTSDCCGGSDRTQSIGSPNYVPMQQASKMADLAQERIAAGDFAEVPSPPEESEAFARVSTFEGFAKVWLADLFCSLAFDGTGPELSSEEVYELAEDEFTKAIDADNATSTLEQAARVGRARVRLILGDDSGALSDAQQVDPGFEWLAQYSTNSFAQQNMVNFRTWQFGNWSVGPVFRDLTVDDTGTPDPRVELALNPRPAFESSQDLYAPEKAGSSSSPLRIATGDEAQYIIAEIEGGQTAVDIINQVRDRHGISEDWQPSGGDPNEIRDKLIEERRRTLFLDGVRLGDLRRYIEKYGLDFFPTSTPQGFPMGDQTCVPLPDVERNNNPDI